MQQPARFLASQLQLAIATSLCSIGGWMSIAAVQTVKLLPTNPADQGKRANLPKTHRIDRAGGRKRMKKVFVCLLID